MAHTRDKYNSGSEIRDGLFYLSASGRGSLLAGAGRDVEEHDVKMGRPRARSSSLKILSPIKLSPSSSSTPPFTLSASPPSTTFLEKRRNFCDSLAGMSIVGYLLGLGDRHPNNLLLHEDSGKVIHVDFGDCFEVTRLRSRFQEGMPFRLTRMLEEACGSAAVNVCSYVKDIMTGSGVVVPASASSSRAEQSSAASLFGTRNSAFRQACIRVLRCLRENADVFLAMLEVFVQDPLVAWRLLHPEPEVSEKMPGHQEGDRQDSPEASQHLKGEQENDAFFNLPPLQVSDNDVEDVEDVVDIPLLTNGGDGDGGEDHDEFSSTRKTTISTMKQTTKSSSNYIVQQHDPACYTVDPFCEIPVLLQEGFAESTTTATAEVTTAETRVDLELALETKAKAVLTRVKKKLEGKDEILFPYRQSVSTSAGSAQKELSSSSTSSMSVEEQVDCLIRSARAEENLVSCYIGWCPFW
ncbi:unnamed protein product [Amoebophrya sp. A25]|nr:unnamed protein product [Amoebophrya sp. A25]|eukprot:GSA25T00021334001.1